VRLHVSLRRGDTYYVLDARSLHGDEQAGLVGVLMGEVVRCDECSGDVLFFEPQGVDDRPILFDDPDVGVLTEGLRDGAGCVAG
jgi:hypothetical protein